MNKASKAITEGIKFYKKHISCCIRMSCRYEPTCSQYAIDAITEYGVIKGLGMALKRILKCNPLFPGGYDPVKRKAN